MLSHISTLITVQRQTGLTVLQEENWFRELAEDLPQLVWAADENGKKTFCSHRYLDYTGADDLEAMDRLWTGFIHPDDRGATADQWIRSLRSGEAYSAEYRLRRRDGVYRYFKAQALPMHDKDGRICGWLGMSRDINEERISDQTREIEAKVLAVRRLASSIAHEINNPLESVTNALFLALQDHNIDVNTRSFLHLADAELQRLAHITTHSLRFHKQSTVKTQRLMESIVEDVLSTYRSRLQMAGISVDRRYRSEAGVVCYAEDLSQAIATLVRNAIEAMKPRGRLSVRIRDARSWGQGGRSGIRVTVADTGEGIPSELRGRVFEPFFTTKGATNTGLALWVAEQIVRKHGGRVSFRSSTDAVHHGTVFAIFLPIDSVPATESAA